MTEYIAVLTFPDRDATYEAYSELKNDLYARGVVSAVIIEKAENGVVTVPEVVDSTAGNRVALGGAIGLLVGILGGPLGMLFGLAVGASGGAIAEASRDDDGDDAISDIATSVAPGSNAILAETNEDDEAPLNAFVGEHNGTVTRRLKTDVEAEIEANQEAQREATHAARKALRERRRAARHGDAADAAPAAS